jgi:hypothetical protein
MQGEPQLAQPVRKSLAWAEGNFSNPNHIAPSVHSAFTASLIGCLSASQLTSSQPSPMPAISELLPGGDPHSNLHRATYTSPSCRRTTNSEPLSPTLTRISLSKYRVSTYPSGLNALKGKDISRFPLTVTLKSVNTTPRQEVDALLLLGSCSRQAHVFSAS